jgi:hypothetical protein
MVFSLFGGEYSFVFKRSTKKTAYFNYLPSVLKEIEINSLFLTVYKNKIIIELKLFFPVNYDPA